MLEVIFLCLFVSFVVLPAIFDNGYDGYMKNLLIGNLFALVAVVSATVFICLIVSVGYLVFDHESLTDVFYKIIGSFK